MEHSEGVHRCLFNIAHFVLSLVFDGGFVAPHVIDLHAFPNTHGFPRDHYCVLGKKSRIPDKEGVLTKWVRFRYATAKKCGIGGDSGIVFRPISEITATMEESFYPFVIADTFKIAAMKFDEG